MLMNLTKNLIWNCNRGKPSISMELGNRRQAGMKQQETSRFRYIRPALLQCRSTGEGGDSGTGLYRERDFY